ncbi:MAG: Re/Si-specific NAD(P)(+) transhydrogenase subunit alpha [Dehalococcoidia bacterium]|jgi:NAD(P) transhydrogenase subunit alpha|nr:Re/Si-specific NAD(P)(+) transhydrogenase subunit alpha [Dehalococcoidia bacterium]
MKIAVPADSEQGEMRVALVPETVGRLARAGLTVIVQPDAGKNAGFPDDAYLEAGADMAETVDGMLHDADIVVKVNQPNLHEIDLMKPGAVVIGLLRARTSPDMLNRLASSGATAFAMELIPRIARAQRMDVLSSQSSLAGYKAVLMAANSIGKFFPLMMTAAGTIPPATVLVLGAGVAGLQAIATARRLGARVEAFDVRPVVKEQVESLGATFVEIPPPERDSDTEDLENPSGYAGTQSEEAQRLQRETLAVHVAKADVVITTALIPGRPAPVLITEEMAEAMQPGSVIVDLAAEAGGNCEFTVPGRDVERAGVTILGPLNIPSMMPGEASVLYSRNVAGLLDLLISGEGNLVTDFEDEVIAGAGVTHGGKVVGIGSEIVGLDTGGSE